MRRSVALIFLFLSLLSVIVFAHPGNTDSKGGHHVTATGEYHYHHGYPPHQHTGGTCPYNFNDKTGESSGELSSESNHSGSKTSAEIDSVKKGGFEISAGGVIFTGALLWLLGSEFVPDFLEQRKIKKQKRAELKQKLDALQKKKEEYRSKYEGLTRTEIALMHGMPTGFNIGADGLPKEETAKIGWGASLTVYISRNGRFYHHSPYCRAGGYNKVHLLTVLNRQPCKLCSHSPEDFTWFENYKKIINELYILQIQIKD